MLNPATYTRLRPIMSDRRPIGKRSALVVSMYPSVTHCTVGIGASKWLAIWGRARLTLVWSITETNMPMAMTPNTHHL